MISQAGAAISCAPSDYGFLRFAGDHPFLVFLCLLIICLCAESIAKIICGIKP